MTFKRKAMVKAILRVERHYLENGMEIEKIIEKNEKA